MAMAALVDVDYGSRVSVAAALCAAVNALGGTQVPVPSNAGSYDHPATLIRFLRAAASATGALVPTDNLDYTEFVPMCNLIIDAINGVTEPPVEP